MQHPSFPWKRPERRTRRTKRLVQTDHRLFQARVPQFADNVNSHPVSLMATHIRIQAAEGPKERLRGLTDSPVASQVINHRAISRRLTVRRQCELPSSVAHGDSHQDPNRQRGEGKIPRPQRLASQVMNHRTISRRLPVVKNSTVSDDFPVTREVEKEKKLEQRVKESLLLTVGTAASSRRNLVCGWLPI